MDTSEIAMEAKQQNDRKTLHFWSYALAVDCAKEEPKRIVALADRLDNFLGTPVNYIE